MVELDKIINCLMVVLVLELTIGVYGRIKINEITKDCSNRNGVIIQTNDGWLCVDKNIVSYQYK